MPRIPENTLIIGGGISGLYFAWLCHTRHVPYLLVEKSNRLGGNIESLATVNGPLEMGAHAFYNSYGRCLKLLGHLNLLEAITPKPRLPYRIRQKSFLKNPLTAVSWMEAARHLATAWVRPAPTALESLEQKFTRLLGLNNYRNLMGPFFNALLNQDARNYPAALALKKRPRQKRFPRAFTLQGGMETLILKLREAIQEPCLESMPAGIKRHENGFMVERMGSPSLEATRIVFATPPEQTFRYLSSLQPELAEHLGGIRQSSILSVAFEIDPLPLPPLSGMIASGQVFRSMITNDTHLSRDKTRTFTFHFPHQSVDATYFRKVASQALGLDEHHRVHRRSQKLSQMPMVTVENWPRIREFSDRITEVPDLFCIGNYFRGAGVEDCLHRSDEEFQRLLSHRSPA